MPIINVKFINMGMLLFDWKILILAFLPIGCICVDLESGVKETYCEHLNGQFSFTNGKFMDCVLKHNEDGIFCEYCAERYANFTSKYNNLVGSDTDAKDGTTCRSRFVDNNQLSLVDSIYANAKHIWEIGSCSGKTNNSIRHF